MLHTSIRPVCRQYTAMRSAAPPFIRPSVAVYQVCIVEGTQEVPFSAVLGGQHWLPIRTVFDPRQTNGPGGAPIAACALEPGAVEKLWPEVLSSSPVKVKEMSCVLSDAPLLSGTTLINCMGTNKNWPSTRILRQELSFVAATKPPTRLSTMSTCVPGASVSRIGHLAVIVSGHA